MELNEAIGKQKQTSGVMVPVILRDAMGREMEIQAPMNIPQVFVGLGPIGCFVFDRTTELHQSLRTVYVQSTVRSIGQSIDTSSAIDV